MPRHRNSTKSSGRLTRNSLYGRPSVQPLKDESDIEETLTDPNGTPFLSYKDLFIGRVGAATGEGFDTYNQSEDDELDEDEDTLIESDEEQDGTCINEDQEGDSLPPAGPGQARESARFEGPNRELLDRRGRRMLGPEGTILINTERTSLESWETYSEHRALRRHPLDRDGNDERRVKRVLKKTKFVGEDRRQRRKLGPEGTILIHDDEPTLPRDDNRLVRRTNGTQGRLRRVGFGPEGTELIEQ